MTCALALLAAWQAGRPGAVGTTRTSKTPILVYHDIVEARGPGSVWFDCTVKEFEDQLGWLIKRGAIFVSLSQIEQALRTKRPLPEKAICLTFADNYASFYTHALPRLRKLKIPVAQCVHTGFVGSKVGRPKGTWAQMRASLPTRLVTFVSQTVSHPTDLTRLPVSAQLKEFTESRATLQRQLGIPVRYLAYPNGKYNLTVSQSAARTGYAMALTEAQQPAEFAPDLYRVPRYVHTKYRIAWNTCIESRRRSSPDDAGLCF